MKSMVRLNLNKHPCYEDAEENKYSYATCASEESYKYLIEYGSKCRDNKGNKTFCWIPHIDALVPHVRKQCKPKQRFFFLREIKSIELSI